MNQFRSRHRLLFPLLLLSLASFLAGCQPAGTRDAQDSISTQGTADVMVAPDQAEIIFGIEHRSKDLADARSQAEAGVHGLLEVAGQLGIPAEQVDSTQIITRPEYRYDEGTRHFIGFHVERRVRITLTDLALLGSLTDGAFKAGINTVEPPQLGVSNPREHYRRALEQAAADARANADTLANSLGAQLGEVLSITEGGSQNAPPMERNYRMAMDAAPETAMQAGQIRFSASVNARFRLVAD